MHNCSVISAYLQQYNTIKSTCNVKTLLAIGGWNQGSATFSTVMADSSLRAIFVESTLKWLQTHGFDGLDLDWEYPAQRGGATADKVRRQGQFFLYYVFTYKS